ncbi:MAG: hypothetical protein AAB855_03220 [Patescibacteria group bacterium]
MDSQDPMILWVLRKRLHHQYRQAVAESVSAHIVNEEHDDVHCAEWNRRSQRLAREFAIVDELFWAALQLQFSEHLKGSIGLREGWRIVTTTNNPGNVEDPDKIPEEIKEVIRAMGGDPAKVKIVRGDTVVGPNGFGQVLQGFADAFGRL